MRFLTGFLASACLVFVTGVCTAAPINVKVSMGSAPIGHPQLKAGEDLNTWIQEKTNGRYAITLMPAGTLGAFDTVYQSTKMGSVPISLETSANLSQFYPELAVLDVPYLFRDGKQLDAFLQSDFMKNALQEMAKKRPGVKLTGANNVSYRYVASKVPFTTLADVQGKKDRVSNNKLHSAAVRAMGMNPTPTAPAEILSSLQQGVVDCTDVEIFWPLTGRLYDVCKNYLQMDAMPVINVTCVSEDWLNKLPKEDRAIWLEGLEYFNDRVNARLAEGRAATIQALKDKGCQFAELSEADKAEAAAKGAHAANILRPAQKEFLEKVRATLR